MASVLSLSLVFSAVSTGYGQENNNEDDTQSQLQDGIYEGSAPGYGDELNLSVEVAEGKIVSITLGEHNESVEVLDRAMPILEERIINEQSPIVDNVSSATFSSYAVKSATAEALKEAGVDYGQISFATDTEGIEREEKEAMQTDIVIIGGGPSGLSAAITAKEAGVENVILVEKLDILSGNGKFDMNFYDMPNSQAMTDNGVEVSKEEFIEMQQAKGTRDSEERLEAWVDVAWEMDEWLRSMGIELNHNYGGEKGMNHMSEFDEYAGNHIQTNMEETAEELGVEIITGTKAVDLIFDEDKVVGVKVEDREFYYDILADSVILATGGFSHNKELLEKYIPGAEVVGTSNHIGAQGDFIPIAEEHDLQLDHMNSLSIFSLINRPRRDLTGAGDGYILVNDNSTRFMNERLSGLDRAHTMLEQPNKNVYFIYDQRLYESMYRPQKHVEFGYHEQGENLEELAEKLGLDAETIREEIRIYNEAVEAGEGDPYRDTPSEFTIDPDGPMYGTLVETAIHMTKGGIVANENAEVLNNEGEVVLGLYAAGEVTDTSLNYSGAVAFGRIAAKQAAEFIAELE